MQLAATQWVIDMHAAFLIGRLMQVKVGNTLSPRLNVTGGAVQGSVLGVMDHNAVMEGVDEDFLMEPHKYVDDLTSTEIWFPANHNQTSERNPTRYHEEFARTQRLYNSPLFYMRRLLNRTKHDPRPDPYYIYLAHLFNDL